MIDIKLLAIYNMFMYLFGLRSPIPPPPQKKKKNALKNTPTKNTLKIIHSQKKETLSKIKIKNTKKNVDLLNCHSSLNSLNSHFPRRYHPKGPKGLIHLAPPVPLFKGVAITCSTSGGLRVDRTFRCSKTGFFQAGESVRMLEKDCNKLKVVADGCLQIASLHSKKSYINNYSNGNQSTLRNQRGEALWKEDIFVSYGKSETKHSNKN